jgi:hypothetical protein
MIDRVASLYRLPTSATKRRADLMELYGIVRRDGWRSVEELQEAAARSTRVGDEEMPDRVRWIRSYVLSEPNGSLGTFCVYEATDPEAIRDHATRAGLPVDEIVKIADTVIVRPDPAVVS